MATLDHAVSNAHASAGIRNGMGACLERIGFQITAFLAKIGELFSMLLCSQEANVMPELSELTITEASELIRTRQVSPIELVDAFLRRIDHLDGALKAWATVDYSGAKDAAREREAEIVRGLPTGPLQGIPFGVKDIFYTNGVLTEAGSKTWAGFVPTFDATAVRKLRQAGGVLLGKTVTTEFADGDPVETLNPWDPGCTPGGSSTGSAVAVASRMCPVALGSQTVGSVLRPAAYNGTVGLKPTFGRISRYGVVPMAGSLDHVGILARTVEDIAVVFYSLAGHDPDDSVSSKEPIPDVLATIRNMAQPRIGFFTGYFYDNATSSVNESMEVIKQKLTEAGALVMELDAGLDFAATHAANVTIQAAETAGFHGPMFAKYKDRYGVKIRTLIETGGQITPEEYEQARYIQRWSRDRLSETLNHVDVILTPTASSLAPRDLSTTGDHSFQSPWTLTGLPSISIPTGLLQEKPGTAPIPMAIQLGASKFAEGKLLKVAYWCERIFDTQLPIPPLAAMD